MALLLSDDMLATINTTFAPKRKKKRGEPGYVEDFTAPPLDITTDYQGADQLAPLDLSTGTAGDVGFPPPTIVSPGGAGDPYAQAGAAMDYGATPPQVYAPPPQQFDPIYPLEGVQQDIDWRTRVEEWKGLIDQFGPDVLTDPMGAIARSEQSSGDAAFLDSQTAQRDPARWSQPGTEYATTNTPSFDGWESDALGRITKDTLSGNAFLNEFGLHPENLPGPLPRIVDAAAAPVNLIPGGRVGSLAGLGRNFAFNAAGNVLGNEAYREAEQRIPEAWPEPVRQGLSLGAGLLVGGGVDEGLRHPGSLGRGIDAISGLEDRALQRVAPQFDAAGQPVSSEAGMVFRTGRPADVAPRRVVPDSKVPPELVAQRSARDAILKEAEALRDSSNNFATPGSWSQYNRLMDEVTAFDDRLNAVKQSATPQPLANERLWFHSTRSMDYELPDPDMAVGTQTGITQGPGIYLAADPAKSAGRYGPRTFVTEFDGTVLDLTAPADVSQWEQIRQRLIAKVWTLPEGVAQKNARYQLEHAFDDAVLQQVAKSARSEMAGVGNGYVYRDSLAEAVGSTVSWHGNSEFLGRFAGAHDKGAQAYGLAAVNNVLADSGVDALFHHSPRADGDVLIVLNGEKARVLGDVRNAPDAVTSGQTWREMRDAVDQPLPRSFREQEGLHGHARFYDEETGQLIGAVEPMSDGRWAGNYHAAPMDFLGQTKIFATREEAIAYVKEGAALRPAHSRRGITSFTGEEGSIATGLAARAGSSAVGAGLGYASGDDQEDRWRRAGLGALGGLLVGDTVAGGPTYRAAKKLTKGGFGGSVIEDVGQAADQPIRFVKSGDFYEAFGDDARTVADLTGRRPQRVSDTAAARGLGSVGDINVGIPPWGLEGPNGLVRVQDIPDLAGRPVEIVDAAGNVLERHGLTSATVTPEAVRLPNGRMATPEEVELMRGFNALGDTPETAIPESLPSSIYTPDSIARVRDASIARGGGPPSISAVEASGNDARRALLDAVKREANIRRSGTAAREIGQGRRTQAGGILSGLNEGLGTGASGEDLIAQARSGARTGALRQTFAEPLALPPEQRASLIDELAQRTSNGEMQPFEFLRATQALQKVFNGEGLQPAEIRSLRNHFGDEMADAIGDRPKTAGQLAKEQAREAARLDRESQAALRRWDREAAAAEVRANRMIAERQGVADRVAERARWHAIAKRNDADEIAMETMRLHDPKTTEEMRNIGQRQLNVLTARAQREAGKAFDAMLAKDPAATDILHRATDVIKKATDSPEGRDALNGSVKAWLAANRVILDGLGETRHEFFRTVGAKLTGDLADSYLSSLLHRKGFLQNALEQQGMEQPLAKKVADTLMDYELKRRYPRGVPPRLTELLEQTKLGYTGTGEQIARGAAAFTQELKNTQFGIGDMAVFGQQFLKSVTTNTVQLLAGSVNRLLAAAHLPSVQTAVIDAGLAKRIQYQLDGVAQGVTTGITDLSHEGTLIGRIPVVGRTVDRPVVAASKALTDFQFKTVLGNVRNLIHEGNLVLAKAVGQDINDPRVRATAAEFANAATSFSPAALKAKRALGEKATMLSPSMRRAQVVQILQVAKLLNGTATERWLAAATILSTAGSLLAVGKLINDYFGIDEFVFDPSAPGFGDVTLEDGTVINLFPQEQVVKAIARSTRALAEGDTESAREAWANLTISSLSPTLQIGARSLGVGYEPGKGYRYGNLNEGMGLGERALNAAPLPPIAGSLIRGEVTPTEAPWEIAGVPAYQESAADKLDRLAREKTGTGFFDMAPPDRRRFLASSEEARSLDDARVKESAATDQEWAVKNVEADRLRAEYEPRQLEDDRLLQAGGDPEKWRQERAKRQLRLSGALDVVYGDSSYVNPEDPLSLWGEQVRLNTIDETTGEVNWDKVEAWVAGQPQNVQDEINNRTASGTPTVQQWRDDVKRIADSGYWDIADEVAMEFGNALRIGPVTQDGLYEYFQQEAIKALGTAYSSTQAKELARAVADRSMTRYFTVLGQERKLWRSENPALVPLLLKWGYSDPSVSETGALIGSGVIR